jgi:hypothetical protein
MVPRDRIELSTRGFRAIAYFYKHEYDKAWDDVSKAQDLGSQIDPEFLKDLREASGRER